MRGRVRLDRALSKLGLASRADARALIASGRVFVDGCVTNDPGQLVVPEQVAIIIDGEARTARPARLLALHKPRGVLTTRRDPDGRRTVFDVLGEAGSGLQAIGRLDQASTGLLLFTNNTRLANHLTDPTNAIPRRYVVTVRGHVQEAAAARLESGIEAAGTKGTAERLVATSAIIRKASARESHLIVELTEGRNRELRRMFDVLGYEVTRIHRIAFGPYELGDLQPGQWRELEMPAAARPKRHRPAPARAVRGRTGAATARPRANQDK